MDFQDSALGLQILRQAVSDIKTFLRCPEALLGKFKIADNSKPRNNVNAKFARYPHSDRFDSNTKLSNLDSQQIATKLTIKSIHLPLSLQLS